MSVIYNVWLREPRKAWRNDGEPIPRGMRGKVTRTGIKSHSVKIKDGGQLVRRGHWVVVAGGQAFCFSPADMRRLYSRVPL